MTLRLALLFSFFLAAPIDRVHAATRLKLRHTLTVYEKANLASPAFQVEAGAVITVGERETHGFKRVRVPAGRGHRTGFATVAGLNGQSESTPRGFWGAGGSLGFSQFAQGEKSFSTKDQVTYKIGGLEGDGLSLGFNVQWGQDIIFRLQGLYRQVSLNGTATTNIPGAPAQPILLEYKMLGGGADLTWSFWRRVFYAGLGGEFAGALSGRVAFANQTIGSAEDLPSYALLSGIAGASFFIGRSWSVFIETRAGAVMNQSPMISVLSVGSGILYWP